MYHPTILMILRYLFGDRAESILRIPQDGGDVTLAEEQEAEQVTDVPADIPLETAETAPAGDPRLPQGHVPFYRWFIDAGHGVFTDGKRGPLLGRIIHIITKQWRLLEWEYNRDVAERIIEQLVALGLVWERTMPADGQHGNALGERVRRANNHPKDQYKPAFVSLHGNAGPSPDLETYADDSVRGIETWYFYGSKVGRIMARVFHAHLLKHTRRFVETTQAKVPAASRHIVDRGLRSKKTGQFYVLRATRMPAVLIESGFMNSRFDVLLMVLPGYRQAVADSVVDSICEIESNKLL